MERNSNRISVVNLLMVLAGCGLSWWVARQTGSLAAQTIVWFFGLASLVTLVSWFQSRLHERDRLEQLEFDELKRAKGATTLFSGDGDDGFPARQARLMFEKWFIPAFAILLIGLTAWAAWYQWGRLDERAFLNRPLIAAALFGFLFLPLFMAGKYASRVAQFREESLIRPGASHVLLCAYLSLAVAVGVLAVYFADIRNADLYLARVMTLVLAVITFEIAVTLVFEIYRPRLKESRRHYVYESRLVGLLGRPEGLFTTAAQALDYQFGFKVSETWFYRFLQRALAWIILAQLVLFALSTCFVFIEPGEQGVRERFGKPVGEPLEAGLHLKLPAGMEAIHRFRTSRIQGFVVGIVPDEDEEDEPDVIQWSVSHYQEEFKMLVASREEGVVDSADEGRTVPVNLLTVSIPVQFQIRDVLQWAYNHSDPGEVLEGAAGREITRYLVNADLGEIMAEGRERAARELTRLIQARADALELGVEILFVGTQDIHPPVDVAPAYQEVVGALQVKETKILEAEGYAGETLPRALADASNQVLRAEAYRFRTVADAEAQAAKFKNQDIAYQASPQVYRLRSYLNTLSRGATNSRLYILSTTNTDEVISFNFEQKIRSDITDIMVPQN